MLTTRIGPGGAASSAARMQPCTVASRRDSGLCGLVVGGVPLVPVVRGISHRTESSHDLSRRSVGNRARSARKSIKGILAHPELELVGCWVHSDDKVGRDVGEICGIGPIGVLATNSLDEICALDADAVVYSPVMASTRDVIRLLESGKNVVTPVGWIYPGRHARRRRAAGRVPRGQASRCTAPAINPGGITERFPLMLSRAVPRHHATCAPRSSPTSATTRPSMVVREVMLFGKDPEIAAKSPMIEILGHGFMQSIDMVCAELGWTLDAEKTLEARDGRSRRVDMDTPVGVIEKGTVAAQRFTWQGTVDGEPVMTVRVELADGRRRSSTRRGRSASSASRSSSTPTPPVSCTFHGLHPPVLGEDPEIGLIPPAMHCVNAIPYVVRGRARHQDLPRPPLLAGRGVRSLNGG